MLDRFKVPKEDIVRVDHESLEETVKNVFMKMGVVERLITLEILTSYLFSVPPLLSGKLLN